MAVLDEYCGPNVAVDIAVLTLTLDGDGLAVLIQNRTKSPRGKVLPGRFLRKGQTVADGLHAALWDKAGLEVGPIDAALDHRVAESDSTNPTKAHLVGVFDKPGRDPRSSWSMSLAHYLVLPRDRCNGAKGEFVPVRPDGSVEPELLFDHDAIVREAARDLRARYELTPDPENLCTGREITLPDLQVVHQAVLGEPVRVDTFRRRMEALLDEVIDPDDPKGRRKKTRPSGRSGGPPARLWAKRSLSGGVPDEGDGVAVEERPADQEAHRLLRLPRYVD
jgi:8-oxo-dGTP diphosphatase